MTASTDVLFRPFRIKSLDLPNRIVMAPMTRTFAPEGIPGAANAANGELVLQAGYGTVRLVGGPDPAGLRTPEVHLLDWLCALRVVWVPRF